MVRLPPLKTLAMSISRYPGFKRPKPYFEQYTTDPEIAAHMVYEAVQCKCPMVAADFGTGTGLLLYAAALTGCLVYGVGLDLDAAVVYEAREALRERKLMHLVDLVVADCTSSPLRQRSIDVVVMNPPFGIRSRRGIDMLFLREALRASRKCIVSLHAWSDGLLEAIVRKTRCKPRVLYQGFHRIPAFLEEHRRRVHRVKVAVVACYVEEEN